LEALNRKCLMVFLAWLPLATLAEIPKGTETQYLRDLASNPKDSARALGWLRSARGLQAIVEAGKPALLYDYEGGLTDRGHSQFPEQRSPMPAEIEHILVQRFDDPVWGRKLLRFLYWEKYQTRDLFDRLYAHIADTQKFDDNYYWYRLIVNTDQIGVDAPLLAALPKLSPDGQRTILSALAQHKYAPALPEMAKFTREHRTDPAWWTKEIYDDLAKMGSRESVEQLMLELGRFSGPLAGDDGKRLLDVISALNALPKDAPLDVARAWSALPHKDDPAVAAACVTFALAHPHPDESTLLVAQLGNMKSGRGAFDALLGIDSPDVWRNTGARIEVLHQAGTLPEGNYLFAKQQLSQRLDHPDEYQRQRVMPTLNAALEKEVGPLQRALRSLIPLRQTDPKRYVEQAVTIVDALEAVADHHKDASYSSGVRYDVLTERSIIALLQRFILRQPLKAIETNEKIFAAQPARREMRDFRAAIQIAEIYRYELGDKVKALEYYQKARDAVHPEDWPGSLRDPDVIATWIKDGLIGKEIDYLTSGRVFSGAVTRRDVEGAGFALTMDGVGFLMLIAPSLAVSAAPADPTVLARLERMPASNLTVMAAILDINGATDAVATVAFLKRSDPVHYVSACVLAILAANENQGPGQGAQGGAQRGGKPTMLRQVIAQFGRVNNIAVHTEPDLRRATPQATWALFIASLKSGDRDTALTCLAGHLQTALSELFRKSSNAQLRQMADEFGPLQPPAAGTGSSDEIQEFGITRKRPQGDQAAFVEFVRAGGEWAVQSM
jgi:tetratricopeptide (TPR) repeat protein